MTSRTRSNKPAAASKAKSTAVQKGRTQKTRKTGADKPADEKPNKTNDKLSEKSGNCNTRRTLARRGLCPLDDECLKNVMEILVGHHPELKQKWEEGRKSKAVKNKKKAVLKPPCLVTGLNTEQVKTLLDILYGVEYRSIFKAVPSRNGADAAMAQVLTKQWGLQEPIPVSKVKEYFPGQKSHQKTMVSSSFDKARGQHPFPPRGPSLPGYHDKNENESLGGQDQKAPGLLSCAPQPPKSEDLGMEEEAMKVKAEQQLDDDYDAEDDKNMLLQDNVESECNQHVKGDIDEDDEYAEDFGCCPADQDALAGELYYPSYCYEYNDFTADELLWQKHQQLISWYYYHQSQCYELGLDTQKPHPILWSDDDSVKDEPMDEVEFNDNDDYSSGFVKEDPSQQVLPDNHCDGGCVKDEPMDEAELDSDNCSGFEDEEETWQILLDDLHNYFNAEPFQGEVNFDADYSGGLC